MTGLEIIKNQITILKSQLDIPGICVGCIEKQLEDLKIVEADLEAWEVVKEDKGMKEIEAIQWNGNNIENVMNFLGAKSEHSKRASEYKFFDGKDLIICTLKGNMKVSIGDYIIKGVQGEFYSCKRDICEKCLKCKAYVDNAEPLKEKENET